MFEITGVPLPKDEKIKPKLVDVKIRVDHPRKGIHCDALVHRLANNDCVVALKMVRPDVIYPVLPLRDSAFLKQVRCAPGSRDSADVLRPLKCCRVGALLLAHASFQLCDRFIVVLFHPLFHFSFNYAQVIDAVAQ